MTNGKVPKFYNEYALEEDLIAKKWNTTDECRNYWNLPKVKAKQRKCLRCNSSFFSEHGERLCKQCHQFRMCLGPWEAPKVPPSRQEE